jgi:hypothetical protein
MEDHRLTAIKPGCPDAILTSADRFTDIIGYTALVGNKKNQIFDIHSQN